MRTIWCFPRLKGIAHLSLPLSIGWVALSFLFRLSSCYMVTPDQISTVFNIYRHRSVVLTQFHLISSSTKLHWPSTTKYQPVPPHTDPVPPSTNQYHLLLTKYQDFSVFLLLCENHISLFWILSSFSSSVYRPFSEKYFPSPYIFLLLLLCRPEMSTVVRYSSFIMVLCIS